MNLESVEEVSEFILWLCGWLPVPDPLADDHQEPMDPEDLVEHLWGWRGAPKMRMAKLLWQQLVGSNSESNFAQQFSSNPAYLVPQIAPSIKQLVPVQQNLRWILEARMEREREDTLIGQGSWGEDFWLPRDQAAYLRQQIRRASPDLIEEDSLYEDSMEHTSLPYFELDSDDAYRKYVGTVDDEFRAFVEIVDSQGNRWPLKFPHSPYKVAPGTGFFWGYGGHGPYNLALAILADAVGGDYELSDKLRSEFLEQVLMETPQSDRLEISRAEVMAWLKTRGVSAVELEDAAGRVAKLRESNHQQIGEFTLRMETIRKKGGLVAQRFDIVPVDFECALYLDLMQNLERTGWVLRCSHCKQALPCPRTPTGNRQRARWIAGRPVYHEDCFMKHRLARKRAYWQKRTETSGFRDSERLRAQRRRRVL
jgi:hypothetical protein